MNLRYLPNLISIVRILLVVPVVVLLVQERFGPAVVLFTVAGASDALDGFLARRYGWFSSLGGWLDPVADKTMMVSSYAALAWLGLIPVWLVAAVVARDVVIVLGSLFYYHYVEKVHAEPSWISKVNTVVQILLVISVMLAQVTAVPGLWIEVLKYTVLATILLSGLGYVLVWGSRALHLKGRGA